MFQSIIEDVKQSFRSGNMITRLIIINIIVYMVMAILNAFTPADSGFFSGLIQYLAIPGPFPEFLWKFWTWITHMFLHSGLWHMAINMLYLYWFGRITGDLIGDRHVLPGYILGGLAGAVAYILSYQLLGSGVIGGYALGASAAVMSLVIMAGIIAPDYNIRLLFLGNVKLKFIVLAIIFFDLISIGRMSNTGGHIAHLGGMLMGAYYIYSLRSGRDLSTIFSGVKITTNSRPRHMKVHRSSDEKKKPRRTSSEQEEIDKILEKIKRSGYESLTDEEKDILFKASNNK